MSSSTLETHAQHLLSSIDLCFKKQFITPSLMLAYATIDIMAWLDRDENHQDVLRDDFINWVETYLLLRGARPSTGGGEEMISSTG